MERGKSGYTWGIGVVLCSLALTVAAVPDVKYTTVTKVQLGGALGKTIGFLARLGGAPEAFSEVAYVKGNRMRTDAEEMSTLIDLDGERLVTLDHKRKTYSVMTFEELRRRLEEAWKEAEAEAAAAEAKEEPEEAGEPSNTEVTFDLSVDRTGETERISGYRAERVLMHITVEATNTAPEESEEQGLEGTMVIASELWMSSEVSGYEEVEAFHQRMAERMGEELMGEGVAAQGFVQGMQQALASDPRMGEGLEKAQAEAAKLEGMAVRNTTHVVLVPKGVAYEPDLVFKKQEEQEKKKGGFGRLARRVAEQAAGVGGGKEPEAAAPQQATILTVTSELQDVETVSLPASLFEIPADYKQMAPEEPLRQ